MKKLTTFFLTLLTISVFSQVSVEEKKVNIDGTKDGFYLSIPYGTAKQIEKELKDELKTWGGKYSDGEYVFVQECKLKDMGKKTFDVYAIIQENLEGGAFVSIAIDLGGAFLNSSEHADQAKVMNATLHKFGVSAAKNVVEEEIKAEKKMLEEREKELSDLEKEQAKLEGEIEDYKKKIAENEKAIEEAKKNQESKKQEIKEQEGKLKAVEQKKEAVK